MDFSTGGPSPHPRHNQCVLLSPPISNTTSLQLTQNCFISSTQCCPAQQSRQNLVCGMLGMLKGPGCRSHQQQHFAYMLMHLASSSPSSSAAAAAFASMLVRLAWGGSSGECRGAGSLGMNSIQSKVPQGALKGAGSLGMNSVQHKVMQGGACRLDTYKSRHCVMHI
eukprot:1146656-Pelagomonas_calceolata.AAC.6